MSQNKLVCRCLNVTRSEIEQAVSVFSAENEQDVARLTEAGTGCMCCHRCIRQIIREHSATKLSLEMA